MNIVEIKKNMVAYSGETFRTRTGKEFSMNYDGGNTFEVVVENGQKHCFTIVNLDRVVNAINSGKITLTNPIPSIIAMSNCTASVSYIVGLLGDDRIG